ncbi:MAG TPA: cytochrome C oxidase subunit IV family protein [Vicinamibacterales bacterium]|nr:cytochrome C oxidase subunit IV family protein [Vicinamibacterales bacterium]
MSAEHAHSHAHPHAHESHESHGAGHVSPIGLYVTIFLSLMVLTGLTVGAAFVNLGQFNFLVAMIIAVFKASLVVWYFMHVKYQSHLTKLTVATGLFFLAILLGLMLIDYGSKTGPPGAYVPLPGQTDSDSQIGPAR